MWCSGTNMSLTFRTFLQQAQMTVAGQIDELKVSNVDLKFTNFSEMHFNRTVWRHMNWCSDHKWSFNWEWLHIAPEMVNVEMCESTKKTQTILHDSDNEQLRCSAEQNVMWMHWWQVLDRIHFLCICSDAIAQFPSILIKHWIQCSHDSLLVQLNHLKRHLNCEHNGVTLSLHGLTCPSLGIIICSLFLIIITVIVNSHSHSDSLFLFLIFVFNPAHSCCHDVECQWDKHSMNFLSSDSVPSQCTFTSHGFLSTSTMTLSSCNTPLSKLHCLCVHLFHLFVSALPILIASPGLSSLCSFKTPCSFPFCFLLILSDLVLSQKTSFLIDGRVSLPTLSICCLHFLFHFVCHFTCLSSSLVLVLRVQHFSLLDKLNPFSDSLHSFLCLSGSEMSSHAPVVLPIFCLYFVFIVHLPFLPVLCPATKSFCTSSLPVNVVLISFPHQRKMAPSQPIKSSKHHEWKTFHLNDTLIAKSVCTTAIEIHGSDLKKSHPESPRILGTWASWWREQELVHCMTHHWPLHSSCELQRLSKLHLNDLWCKSSAAKWEWWLFFPFLLQMCLCPLGLPPFVSSWFMLPVAPALFDFKLCLQSQEIDNLGFGCSNLPPKSDSFTPEFCPKGPWHWDRGFVCLNSNQIDSSDDDSSLSTTMNVSAFGLFSPQPPTPPQS